MDFGWGESLPGFIGRERDQRKGGHACLGTCLCRRTHSHPMFPGTQSDGAARVNQSWYGIGILPSSPSITVSSSPAPLTKKCSFLSEEKQGPVSAGGTPTLSTRANPQPLETLFAIQLRPGLLDEQDLRDWPARTCPDPLSVGCLFGGSMHRRVRTKRASGF